MGLGERERALAGEQAGPSSPDPSSELCAGSTPSSSRLRRSPGPARPARRCSSPRPPPSPQSRWGLAKSGPSPRAEGTRCPAGWHFLCWRCRHPPPPPRRWTERLRRKQKEPDGVWERTDPVGAPPAAPLYSLGSLSSGCWAAVLLCPDVPPSRGVLPLAGRAPRLLVTRTGRASTPAALPAVAGL